MVLDQILPDSAPARGLTERLAEALGCSPADLTGDRLRVHDRRVLAVAASVPSLTAALHDSALDDHPDAEARPIGQLRLAAARDPGHGDAVVGEVGGRMTGCATERTTP